MYNIEETNYYKSRSGYLRNSLVFLIPTFIVLYFYVFSDEVRHWFLLPVLACGILTTYDLIKWFRKIYDVFDPLALVGILGFHFFFLSPILAVYWDFWLGLVVHPEDWKPWLGVMGIINFVGLLMFRYVVIHISNKKPNAVKRVIVPKRFLLVLIVALSVSFVIQIYFYQKVGGFTSFLTSQVFERKSLVDGTGFLVTISECFPILLVFLIVLISNREKKKTIIFLVGALIGLFALKMFFGGFRGSRNSTIWFLFWAVVIFHQYFRRINIKQVLIGVLLCSTFMYFYGFYKSNGVEGFNAIFNSSQRSQISEKNNSRTVQFLLLRDYSRSDLQALFVQRLVTEDYNLAFGKSYLGDISVLLPDSIISNDLVKSKRYYGTQLQFAGSGLPSHDFLSSNLYGLTGEWMMNFGYVTAPLAFIFAGIFVGIVRRNYLKWERDDARRLLIPLFINLSFLLFMNDLDNHIFFIIKNGAIAILVLYLGTKKVILSTPTS